MGSDPVVLRAEQIVKRYGATQALGGVDLELRGGEIHALLGGNGSGKSTLIKVLSAVEHADQGSVTVGGNTHNARRMSPADVEPYLSVVHQSESTFGSLTVTENLAASDFGVPALGRIQWRALREKAQSTLDRFQIDAEPGQKLDRLGPATQKMVAIARAMQRHADAARGILILDEPTAALPTPDVKRLLAAIKSYAEAGWSILYVTHRLDELPGFVDRATFLRDGLVVDRAEGDELTLKRLVQTVSGEVLEAAHTQVDHSPEEDAEPRLVLRGVSARTLEDASLVVRRGEIVGVGGLLGSGRSTLLRVIFGSQRRSAGEVEIDGHPARTGWPAADPAVAFVPEDRTREAAFMTLNVRENLSAARIGDFSSRLGLRQRRERKAAEENLATYSIRAASSEVPLGTLSGGNQQKVILARWLERGPSVLLLDEPTQGVDVASRAEIHGLIRRALR